MPKKPSLLGFSEDFQPLQSTNQTDSSYEHSEATPNNLPHMEVNGGLQRIDSARKKETRNKHLPYSPDAQEQVEATQNTNLSKEDISEGLVPTHCNQIDVSKSKLLPELSGLDPIHCGQNQKDVSKPNHLPEISDKHDAENNIPSVTNEAGTPRKSRTESITTTQSENQFGSRTPVVLPTQPNARSPTDDTSSRTRNNSQTNAFGVLNFYNHGEGSKYFELEASDELPDLTQKEQTATKNEMALKIKNAVKIFEGYDIEKLAETRKSRSNGRFENNAADKHDAGNSILPVTDETGTPEKTRTESLSIQASKKINIKLTLDTSQGKPPLPIKPWDIKSTVDASNNQPRKGGRLARKPNSPEVNLEKFEESNNPDESVMFSDEPDGKKNSHLNSASKCSVTDEAKIRRTISTGINKSKQSECLQNLELAGAMQDTWSFSTSMPIVFYVSCDYIGLAVNKPTGVEQAFYPATLALTTNHEWMIGEDERTKTALHVWKLSTIWDLPDYNYWKGNSIFWNGKELKPTLEFLLSVILINIRKEFASYLSDNHQETLIAIPFWFTSSQRQQILDAALLAGFKKANIVNENTSLAYYMLAEGILSNEKLVVISESHNTLDIAVYEFKRCKAPLMLASSEPIFITNSPQLITKHPRGRGNDISSKLDKVWHDIKTNQLKNTNIHLRVLVSYESELLLEDIQTFAESISKENLLLLKKEPALQGLFCINKTKLHNQDEAFEELLYDGTSYPICVTSLNDRSFEEHISRISVASLCENSMTCKLLKTPLNTYYVKQVINSDKSWVAGIIRTFGPFDRKSDYTATFSFSVDGIIFLRKIEKRTKTAMEYSPCEIVDSSTYKWYPSGLSEYDKKEFKQLLQPEESLNENYDIQSADQALSTPVSTAIQAKTKSSLNTELKNDLKSIGNKILGIISKSKGTDL